MEVEMQTGERIDRHDSEDGDLGERAEGGDDDERDAEAHAPDNEGGIERGATEHDEGWRLHDLQAGQRGGERGGERGDGGGEEQEQHHLEQHRVGVEQGYDDDRHRRADEDQGELEQQGIEAVSYTHLTLPTILRV